MQQYRDIKARHPDAILLFRMGDFYEMFYEDAETASRILGLTLTSRNNGGAAEVPLAGVPVKAVNEYLRRLVHQGFRVAICEQVEDPRLAKGIVRREVVETITPGAAFADDLLESARHNFLCAVHRVDDWYGIAAADVSTGAFTLTLAASRDADAVLARFAPREIVVARGATVVGANTPARADGALVTERDAWEFDAELAREELTRHFALHSLDGLGIGSDAMVAVGAGGALLRYLRELQPSGIPHLARPSLERVGGVMPLDEMTRRNLELVESLRGEPEQPNGRGAAERAGTLFGVFDRTQTAMGARLMRQWLLAPLVERAAIETRLDVVEAFVGRPVEREALREALDGVRDVERLAGKVAAGRASPRELGALGTSLGRLPLVHDAAQRVAGGGWLAELAATWDSCDDLARSIGATLVDDAPVAIGDTDTIRAGVDGSLDELRALRDGGKDAIARIQAQERERTGIPSLKVGYNRVFGYYIEITNANRHLVPADYQRRQTLTGGERYVTPALKEYEEKVLTATERIETRERELFEALRVAIAREIRRLQAVSTKVAQLDVLSTFAEVAASERYARPEITDGFDLEITGGRHPVVERMMPRDKFIPNDVRLTEDARLIVLTGPNMAGKSTILRQIGLIQLIAQVGAFVPATRARLGIVDRLFTRVGASDNLVRGQSTFMVEMAETSAILHTATRRSLVLLDEIGRGTSTYDGVSIAWAVSEHLHDRVGCKTVFATHYHELTQLADELGALRNFNVAVREVGDQVLFLHRLQPGGADRSYGIEVGRLAGLPNAVIQRAREVLRSLEGEQLAAALQVGAARRRPAPVKAESAPAQLALFTVDPHPVVLRLRDLEPEAMTPLEALRLVDELVRQAREG
ncbi:MAG: DNA mismatch repair protein MutS [Gemmatimonadaceae bacterium]|nr:DNA mismatch repair protein MutS [Gemmatimonadaceae bacterium]